MLRRGLWGKRSGSLVLCSPITLCSSQQPDQQQAWQRRHDKHWQEFLLQLLNVVSCSSLSWPNDMIQPSPLLEVHLEEVWFDSLFLLLLMSMWCMMHFSTTAHGWDLQFICIVRYEIQAQPLTHDHECHHHFEVKFYRTREPWRRRCQHTLAHWHIFTWLLFQKANIFYLAMNIYQFSEGLITEDKALLHSVITAFASRTSQTQTNRSLELVSVK